MRKNPPAVAPDRPAGARALFDAAWYCRRHPDVAAAGCDPWQHYRRSGAAEGRWPNICFDPDWYGAQAGSTDGDLLGHYAGQGEAAGLTPAAWFDPAWYRRTYRVAPDDLALGHFLRHRDGGKLRPNARFDPGFYRARHPDIASSGADPTEHFYFHGRHEGRLPRAKTEIFAESGLVDENYYLFNAGDVMQAGRDAISHFAAIGWRENRRPNAYFDPAWYRRIHGLAEDQCPLTHYILRGEALGNWPSLCFDPGWYRHHYELADHQSPLAHYLANRSSGRFSPLPFFDVAFYLERHGHEMRGKRDPFAHYLIVGAARGYDPAPWFNAARYPAENPLLRFVSEMIFSRSRPPQDKKEAVLF